MSAPSGIHELGQAPLDPPVRPERSVAVQVIRGDVGVERHGRARATGSAAGAPTARRRRGASGVSSGSRSTMGIADVAAQDGRVRRVGGQDRGRQRGGGRLALGPGHADRRGLAQAQEQVRLRDEGRGRRVARRARAATRAAERGPQPRLGRREVRVDGWRGRDERRARPGRRRVHVRAEGQRDRADPRAPSIAVAELGGRAAVVDRDAGAGVGEEPGQGDPAPGEARGR